MRHGDLTRDEAVEIAGLKAVEAVEAMICEPTSRCQTDGDEAVEYSASAMFDHRDGLPARLVAYYYQMPEDLEHCADDDCDDWDDWEIAGWDIA